ncbi:unnamed protein product [Moneuplotes crassus]|uniref:Uncharacterized protein n=1 Tax=Euplotes crassus TaxID=5936 RepID=A0AAD1URC2_EUPCR|nr:unnamed protein product [Moneuplotes crassus]
MDFEERIVLASMTKHVSQSKPKIKLKKDKGLVSICFNAVYKPPKDDNMKRVIRIRKMGDMSRREIKQRVSSLSSKRLQRKRKCRKPSLNQSVCSRHSEYSTNGGRYDNELADEKPTDYDPSVITYKIKVADRPLTAFSQGKYSIKSERGHDDTCEFINRNKSRCGLPGQKRALSSQSSTINCSESLFKSFNQSPSSKLTRRLRKMQTSFKNIQNTGYISEYIQSDFSTHSGNKISSLDFKALRMHNNFLKKKQKNLENLFDMYNQRNTIVGMGGARADKHGFIQHFCRK